MKTCRCIGLWEKLGGYDEDKVCPAGEEYGCTLPEGHKGPHLACGSIKAKDVHDHGYREWTDKEAP
jgi:hypothetical protein